MKLLFVALFFGLNANAFTLSPESKQKALEHLKKLTLKQKIAQMTQAERQHATPEQVKKYGLGSILSGGGSNPTPNTPKAWKEMVKDYYDQSMESAAKIPLIYGVDAVHGHNNVLGATIFPHNIGLGVANDLELTKKMGEIVAKEMKATGIYWNFAPTTAIAMDKRWGRFYESFSNDTKKVTELSMAYMLGLQQEGVLATPKHYLGDGGTEYGHDRGDTILSEEEIRKIHLPPYIEAIKKGALSIMVSFSSINGEKMHGHKYWITDVLKNELGFSGFTVSDWNGIEELDGDYKEQIMKSVNAGIDLFMVPERWLEFMTLLEELVSEEKVSLKRIDDAVYRLLAVKYEMGLFNLSFEGNESFGTKEHRAIANDLAKKSVVIKNQEGLLNLKNKRILLTGKAANNTGYQCGGWTVEWQGVKENVPGATSLFDSLKSLGANVTYISTEKLTTIDASKFDIAITVMGENPYTEMMGDIVMNDYPYPDRTPYGFTLDYYSLHPEDKKVITHLKELNLPIVSVIYSGRELNFDTLYRDSISTALAWLPGSETRGLAELILGIK